MFKQANKTEPGEFPLKHYSYSSLVAFTTNPILFKLRYIQGQQIETTRGISGVVGQAFHKALEVYYGGSDLAITNEAEAVEYGLKAGAEYLQAYNDGYIEYSTTIPNKEKAYELVVEAFKSYIAYKPWDQEEVVAIEEKLEENIDVEWRGQRVALPVKLKGYIDKIVRVDGKLKIVDYKTVRAFANEDKIDGAKIIQAVQYYLLAYAKYGEEPHSITYQEVKLSKNRDGSPQVREYEMVYGENDLYFDLYFRLYEDVTRAINGEQVYVPNFYAMFDNEIALVAYLHRLDVEEEQAKLMKKHRVDNITDLLTKKIQSAGNMQKFLKAVEGKVAIAKNIDYTKMKNHEKIQTKLLEHGMVLQYDSTKEGATVDLYRYHPTIGLKMSKLQAYTADIEQVLGATNVRILAPIPGTSLVGFEVPRSERRYPGTPPKADGLLVPIGVDIHGEPQSIDVRRAPHILVAGTTGSGKSETLRAILASLGNNVELWIADPKGNEFHTEKSERYAEDPEEIRTMLEEAAVEMDRRYAIMKKQNERDWTGKPILLLIDEFGDFILNNPSGAERPNYDTWTKGRLARKFDKMFPDYDHSNFSKESYIRVLQEEDEKNLGKYAEMNAEDLIVKLAQKARAAGIHMIIATQSPRATVVTGRIKANFPTRIALRASGEIESRIVLDQPGAEKLLGKGDMLIMRSDSSDIIRLQGYKV